MGKMIPYDPQSVTITAFGAIMQGFATDSMVEIENMDESFHSEVGVDGEVTRSRSSDRRVRVKLKFMQSSASNAVLSAQHTLDLQSPNGAGVGFFRMDYTLGGTVVQGDQCWIVGWPSAETAKTAKAREWVLEIADGKRFEGG